MITNEQNRDLQFEALPDDLKEAAKRATDAVMLHLSVNKWWDIREKYMVIKLDDGRSNGNLYDTYGEAVRDVAPYESLYYFLSYRNLGAAGANVRELALVLQFARKAREAGMKFTDPDAVNGGRELLLDSENMDYYRKTMFPKITIPQGLFRR